MDIIMKIIKNKQVQRFVGFCIISVAIILLSKPLIGEIEKVIKGNKIVTKTELYQGYDGEGNNEKAVKILLPGEEVEILDQRETWLKIKDAKGDIGWVPKSSLEKQENPEPIDSEVNNPIYQVVTIETDQGIIYTKPTEQSMRMGETTKYTHLLLLHDMGDGWAQVQYNGQVGWLETQGNDINEIVSTTNSPEAVLYSSPSTSSDVVVAPNPGSALQVLEDNSDFIKVKYQQYTGYIESNKVTYSIGVLRDLLRDQAHMDNAPNNQKVLIPKLNETPIVSEPDAESSVITTVSAGTKLNYEDREGDYYKITLETGQVGYIPYWLVITNFAPIESDATIPTSLAGATIVIDPGHGGVDPGAVVDFSPTHESELTLSTALLVKEALEKEGAKVILTREDDSSVGLVERAQISNRNDADVFISLHYDSTLVDTLSGTTVYYYSLNDQSLAETVKRYMAKKLTLPNHGAYFENYAVTRENNQPAILVELGYLNNRSDNALVNTKAYQEDVANTLVEALKEYFQ